MPFIREPPQGILVFLTGFAEGYIFSKIYYFLFALWDGICYNLHSEIEVFTFWRLK